VCLHARAGDIAAAEMGEASLLAGDILAAVPRALQELTQHHDGN
ncbi:NAD(P)H-hydrate dehydratase, partial [Acidithiobacillus ferridurans]|nr:NAD(P)H-hydrate dehydratase [Acidithiobacillus ferridurans]